MKPPPIDSPASTRVSRRAFARVAASAAGIGALGLPLSLQAQDDGATLRSELLMDVEFDTQAAQNLGARQIVTVTGGTFTGPKMKGTVLPGGGDWIIRRPDGASELNVRATLKTDDDQLIYISYRGILYTPAGAPPTALYWKTTPVFETASPKYDWLTRIIAVGVGRRVPGKAAYRIFAII